MEKKIDELKKILNEIGMIDDVEVNEELVHAIYGDNLEIEMTEEEIKFMFLYEL